MKKHTVTEAYNKEWQKKIKEEGRLQSQKRVLYAFSKLFYEILQVPFKGNIVDLGCGDGSLVEVLNRQADIYATGIDINHGVDFETDFLPYEDNKFDIAIMYSVIEHLYDPGKLLSELKRVLKEGGHMIIITANFDLANSLVCDRSFYNDPTHVHPYNPISLQHLMQCYHFQKKFIGLWTVPKSTLLWRLPMKLQFYIGALLPFSGTTKGVPSFLKGKSKTMLCVFENVK